VLYIPKGLYGCKNDESGASGFRMLASRMLFYEENKIRIINRGGLDTILELDFKTNNKMGPDTVRIKSICKIDHFDETKVEKHAMLDRNILEIEQTLPRLVRTNQMFKVRQYHLKAQIKQRDARLKSIKAKGI
jgi:hypothetical protein